MRLLPGADGDPAGGQPAGRQHDAADGSALLVRPLAALQRQVCSHQGVCHTHPITSLSHVSSSPVCSDSNTRQTESCVRWQGSRFPNQTGETGEAWGRVGGEQPQRASHERALTL